MNDQDIINDAFNTIPADSVIFVSKLGDIADRIQQLLDEKNWTQKDLALAMGKQESEISKWLTTIHNFTLRSIAKMEAVLGADIVKIPLSEEIAGASNYVYIKVIANSNANQKDIFAETPVTHTSLESEKQYFSIAAKSNSLWPAYEDKSFERETSNNFLKVLAS